MHVYCKSALPWELGFSAVRVQGALQNGSDVVGGVTAAFYMLTYFPKITKIEFLCISQNTDHFAATPVDARGGAHGGH